MSGEKNKELEGVWLPMGSPPHGRGKDFLLLDRLFAQGITPAWAGKRLTKICRMNFRWDHPRMGGEKPVDSCDRGVHTGSPPRGRGKALCRVLLTIHTGITPA